MASRQWPLLDFLARTISVIRQSGFTTKRTATAEHHPTWTVVVNLLTIVDNANEDNRLSRYKDVSEGIYPISKRDYDEAEETIQWALWLTDEQMDQNSYLHNLNLIAHTGVVKQRTAALACSMVNEFHKQKESREKQSRI